MTQLSKCYLPPPGHLFSATTSLGKRFTLGRSNKSKQVNTKGRKYTKVCIISNFPMYDKIRCNLLSNSNTMNN